MTTFLYPQLTAILKGTPTREDWDCVVKTILASKRDTQDEYLNRKILITLCIAAKCRAQLDVVPHEVESMRISLQQSAPTLYTQLLSNVGAASNPTTKHDIPTSARFELGLACALPAQTFRTDNIPNYLQLLGEGGARDQLYNTADLPRLAPLYPYFKEIASKQTDLPPTATAFLAELAKLYLRDSLQKRAAEAAKTPAH